MKKFISTLITLSVVFFAWYYDNSAAQTLIKIYTWFLFGLFAFCIFLLKDAQIYAAIKNPKIYNRSFFDTVNHIIVATTFLLFFMINEWYLYLCLYVVVLFFVIDVKEQILRNKKIINDLMVTMSTDEYNQMTKKELIEKVREENNKIKWI